MANKDRGEVTLQTGDVTHKLRFTVNSLCNLEDALDMSIIEIGNKLSDVKKVRVSLLRTILKHCLPGGTTDDQAGEIIGEVGLPATMSAISEAIKQAFPEAKAAEKNPK